MLKERTKKLKTDQIEIKRRNELFDEKKRNAEQVLY